MRSRWRWPFARPSQKPRSTGWSAPCTVRFSIWCRRSIGASSSMTGRMPLVACRCAPLLPSCGGIVTTWRSIYRVSSSLRSSRGSLVRAASWGSMRGTRESRWRAGSTPTCTIRAERACTQRLRRVTWSRSTWASLPSSACLRVPPSSGSTPCNPLMCRVSSNRRTGTLRC